MRNSKQRDLILKIVTESKMHPTAEDIYNECRKYISNISLGTVYRNLNTLVDLNEIIRISGVDGMDHFDKLEEHHHFICEMCNKIIDIYELNLPKYDTILDNKVTNTTIIFKGFCKDCSK